MKKKSLMILGIYLIVCFVGVSFAWMQASEGEGGNAIVLSYDKTDPSSNRYLYVKSRGVEAEAYVYDKTVKDYVVTSNLSESYLDLGLIPNSPLLFKIELNNRVDEVQTVSLELAGVTCSNPLLLDNMYFALTSTTGYPEYSTYVPKSTYILFRDNAIGSSSYTISLIKNLQIPCTLSIDSTTQEETLSPICIYGYFILSRLASSTLENVSLNIGYFRVVL